MRLEPVIKNYMRDFSKKFSFESLNDNAVFERFVNYNILYKHNAEAFLGSSDFLEKVSVGNGNDLGIDGIGIKINDVFVTDKREIEDIVEKTNRVRCEFIFIQSKDTTKFDLGEYQKFLSGVLAFLSESQANPVNKEVRKYLKLKEYIFSDDFDVIWEDNPSIKLYYVYLGTIKYLAHTADADNQFLEAVRHTNCYNCEDQAINIIDSEHLKRVCAENLNLFTTSLDIIYTMPFESVENVENSCVAICTGEELCNKLLRAEDDTIRRNLFYDNVRDFQGETAINEDIRSTIKEDPNSFVLMNNGITVVCDSLLQQNRKLTLKNPQIVNGCQTSNMIFLAQKEGANISKINVIMRIIGTQDDLLAGKIVKGTNKQNIVYDEAFETTKKYHKDMEEAFPLLDNLSGVKLYYERRSKQYRHESIKQNQKVSMRSLLQGYVAMFIGKPEEAYRHESKLLSIYDGKVFVERHSVLLYYTVAVFEYYWSEYIRKNSDNLKQYKNFLYHLMFASLLLIDPKIPVKEKEIDSYCKKLITYLRDNANIVFKRAVEVFENSRAKWIEMGRSIDGLKDVADFTKVMLVQCGNAETVSLDTREYGTVYRVIRGEFGFIKCENGKSMFFHKYQNPSVCLADLLDKKVSFVVSSYESKITHEKCICASDMRIES